MSARKRCISPGITLLKHGIKYNKKLSHAGGKSYLLRLPCDAEVVIERLNYRVKACSYQCSHVQRTSNRGSSALHCMLAPQSPTVAVKRCDTPTNAAICLLFSLPSSGSSIRRVAQRVGTTLATLRSRLYFACSIGLYEFYSAALFQSPPSLFPRVATWLSYGLLRPSGNRCLPPRYYSIPLLRYKGECRLYLHRLSCIGFIL